MKATTSSNAARTGFSVATALAVSALALLPTLTAEAADIFKANNADALNLTTSWVAGVVPSQGDIAAWDSSATGANTVALGANQSWQGIRIANPGGAVTVTHAAGQSLTLGSAGIDMSAATQNLTLLNSANVAGSVAIGANQTWNVATGRTLVLFSNSNTQNQSLTGSGNIQVTDGGTVRVLVGDAGSTTFVAGNGNDTYTGNWTISGGSKVISLRNGTHAWGKGTITLDNGTMSQEQGNWSFSNNITVAAGGGTITNDSSGNNRYMNLTGVISGSGPLAFNSLAAMTAGEGFILTGENTFTGPMTIHPNATVRIGGDATTTANSAGAGTLGSIPSTVAITNNGILGFGRTDAHTFANAISGTGIVRLGRAGGTLPASQVVTLSGASTYTGATQVNAGRLNLTGSLTSSITVASGGAISGTGSSTGSLTMNTGSILALAGGTTTTSLMVNGATFNASTLRFDTAPVAGTVYNVVTYGMGGLTTPGNLAATVRGTFADDTVNQKYTFTAGELAATRTWNTASGTWAIGGTATNFAEGDQKFFNSDKVTFNEPGETATITLVGRLEPGSVTVNNTTNPYTITGTAGTNEITGAASLTKAGTGTLVIASRQSYTGGTTVNSGVLDLTGGGGATGALRGTVTVNSGATLRLSTGDATGYNTGTDRVSQIDLNGGTLHVNTTANQTLGSAVINLTGGSITGIGGSNLDLFANGSAINTLASATTSTISLPTLGLRQNDSTFTIADGAAAVDLLVSSRLTDGGDGAGNNALIKNGAGAMELAAMNNTYTGPTVVNEGTLQVSGSISGTTAVNVNNTGILLLSGTGIDRIRDSAPISLSTGSMGKLGFDQSGATAQLSETVGTLTLADSSIIDLGSGSFGSVLHLADSSGMSWSGTLSIYNWSGSASGGGTDQIFFGSNFSSLTPAQLSQIIFYSDLGQTSLGSAQLLSSGELVAVPEPNTVLIGAVMLGLVGWRERRRQRGGQQSPVNQ